MKKTVMIVLIVFLFFGSAWAEEEKKTKDFSVSVGAGFSSQYIDKVTGETIHSRSVVQPYLEIEHINSGLYLGTWASHNFKNFKGDSANEVDPYLGLRKEIGDIKLDVGYTYVDMKNSRGNFHSFHLMVDLPETYSITPYVHIQADKPVRKEIIEGGFAWRLGVKYTLEVEEQPINLDLSFGGHDGIYGYRPELISSGRATISTTFKIFDTVEITPEVNFQKRLGYSVKDGGIAQDRFWIGATVNIPVEILTKNGKDTDTVSLPEEM